MQRRDVANDAEFLAGREQSAVEALNAAVRTDLRKERQRPDGFCQRAPLRRRSVPVLERR